MTGNRTDRSKPGARKWSHDGVSDGSDGLKTGYHRFKKPCDIVNKVMRHVGSSGVRILLGLDPSKALYSYFWTLMGVDSKETLAREDGVRELATPKELGIQTNTNWQKNEIKARKAHENKIKAVIDFHDEHKEYLNQDPPHFPDYAEGRKLMRRADETMIETNLQKFVDSNTFIKTLFQDAGAAARRAKDAVDAYEFPDSQVGELQRSMWNSKVDVLQKETEAASVRFSRLFSDDRVAAIADLERRVTSFQIDPQQVSTHDVLDLLVKSLREDPERGTKMRLARPLLRSTYPDMYFREMVEIARGAALLFCKPDWFLMVDFRGTRNGSSVQIMRTATDCLGLTLAEIMDNKDHLFYRDSRGRRYRGTIASRLAPILYPSLTGKCGGDLLPNDQPTAPPPFTGHGKNARPVIGRGEYDALRRSVELRSEKDVWECFFEKNKLKLVDDPSFKAMERYNRVPPEPDLQRAYEHMLKLPVLYA